MRLWSKFRKCICGAINNNVTLSLLLLLSDSLTHQRGRRLGWGVLGSYTVNRIECKQSEGKRPVLLDRYDIPTAQHTEWLVVSLQCFE